MGETSLNLKLLRIFKHIMKRTFLLNKIFLGISFGLMMSPITQAENWPQWRGPDGNGVAGNDSKPPTTWNEKKNVQWKTLIPGSGHSTPIIWGDKLFVMSAVGEKSNDDQTGRTQEGVDPARQGGRQPRGQRPGGGFGRGGFGRTVSTTTFQFVTYCLNKNTGKVIWQKTARKQKPVGGSHQTNTYSSASPVTDGKVVISNFNSYGIYCYDMDGNLKWEKDLGDMRTRNGFGEGSSAAIHGNTVFVLWDTEDESYLYALDKLSGNQKWRVSRDEATGWTTPLVLTHKGVTQVIVNGSNRVRSYDVMNGELIWECGGQTTNAIPSLVADETTIYAMSGYRGNTAMAIELGGKGDITNSEKVVWSLDRGTPYVPSPLLYDGLLYFCKRNDGFFTCVETVTGHVYYEEERLPDISGVYASPVAANGYIYLPSQNGSTIVLKAGDKLDVAQVNELSEPINASPAISGNKLFLRGSKHIYCISE